MAAQHTPGSPLPAPAVHPGWREAYVGGWWSRQLTDGTWLHVGLVRGESVLQWRWEHVTWERQVRDYVAAAVGDGYDTAEAAQAGADAHIRGL